MKLNKIYATRAELLRWNTALHKMAIGVFEPEIIEMITEAEEDDRQRTKNLTPTTENENES